MTFFLLVSLLSCYLACLSSAASISPDHDYPAFSLLQIEYKCNTFFPRSERYFGKIHSEVRRAFDKLYEEEPVLSAVLLASSDDYEFVGKGASFGVLSSGIGPISWGGTHTQFIDIKAKNPIANDQLPHKIEAIRTKLGSLYEQVFLEKQKLYPCLQWLSRPGEFRGITFKISIAAAAAAAAVTAQNHKHSSLLEEEEDDDLVDKARRLVEKAINKSFKEHGISRHKVVGSSSGSGEWNVSQTVHISFKRSNPYGDKKVYKIMKEAIIEALPSSDMWFHVEFLDIDSPNRLTTGGDVPPSMEFME